MSSPSRLSCFLAIVVLLIAAFGFAASLTSCGGGGGGEQSGDDSNGDDSGGDDGGGGGGGTGESTVFSLGATADANGRAQVNFELPEFTTKFSVTVETLSSRVRINSVENDRGNEWTAPQGVEVSLARRFSPQVKTANAPSRDVDPQVLDFAAYSASATADAPDVPLVFTINTKDDPNLRSGTLRVNVFLVGSGAQRWARHEVISDALNSMADVFRLQAGIVVQINQVTIDGPDLLPNPLIGSEFYLSASSSAPSPAVNLFIGNDVDLTGGGDTLGIAADVPGPPNPSPRSATAISLFVSAGPDGRFSDNEKQLLGETFTHELSHYMGLFHPVEIGGAAAAASDPLDDTPECSTAANCLNDEALTTNVMFPFPVPEGEDLEVTVPQDRLTSQQRSVLNQYIVVN